jgi:hypothetical protein
LFLNAELEFQLGQHELDAGSKMRGIKLDEI